MGKELEPQAKYFEGSWVCQFRASNHDTARHFAQHVANVMEKMGAADVGWDIREGSGAEFAADESAQVKLTEDRVTMPLFPESVPHSEVERQLKEGQRQLEAGDGESS